MRSSTALSLCLLLALSPACSSSPDDGSAGGGPDGGGTGGGEADAGGDAGDPGGPPDQILWTYPYVLQVEFAPALSPDGTIAVHGKSTPQTPEGGPTLVALSRDGDFLWGAATSPGAIPAPPATIYDGQVLVPAALPGAQAGLLYRYQLADGAPLDLVDLEGPVTDGLAVGADGTIYAAATPLQAIADGAVAWSYPMEGGGKTGSNAVVGPSGTIYVGGRGVSEHNLHAVSPDGTRKWARDLGTSIIDPIAVDDQERVYALSANGLLVAYEASGDLAWSVELPSGNGGGGIVIGPDGTIYVGTIGSAPGSYSGEYLYAVRDGEIVWQKLVGLSWIPTTPALSQGGTLYVTDFCKTLVAVRASDGEELWSYELPEVAGQDLCAGFSAPALGPDGRVYVWNEGLPDGTGGGLYVFRGDGTGPADSPWPQEGGDAAHTGRIAAGAR